MFAPALPLASDRAAAGDRPLLFAGAVGFYFIFRACLTFLFFQNDPVLGTIVAIAFDLALLYGAVLYTTPAAASPSHPTHLRQSPLRIAPIQWIVALLIFSLASLAWTAAQSAVAALAYWLGMFADVAIVLLLLRHGDTELQLEGIMKGAVWGAAALTLVAWCSPATADLRLGNDAFLHPNTLGLEFGIVTLIGQYFAPRDTLWKVLTIALAITLVRTLSKTAIIAFVLAECWYLAQSRQMTRSAKLRICALALLVVAAFSSLLTAYIDVYNNTGSGDQVETLTGRTVLWAAAFSMGLETPWLGHGIYSFKALIPALGDFQPVHAHNELLQQFFEFGLVGVAIAAGVHWSFYRHLRRAPPTELKMLALTLLIFSLLHGLTDTVPFGYSYPLWLLVALSLCLAGPAVAQVHRP